MSKTVAGIVIALMVLSLSLEAQMKIIRGGGDGKQTVMEGDIFDLPELGSLIMFQDGKVVVQNVFEKQMRPKAYESVDIQEGDVILMVNGKKLKSLKDLKDSYASASVGSAVKLGIERKGEMTIVSFDKADPDKLPKRRIMINNDGGEGHDILIIPGTGLLVGSKGKDVVVEDILKDIPSSLKDADVKKGDKITAVNDIRVKSFKDFSESFEKIAIGDNVTVHTSRNGKVLSFSFKKSEPKGQRIIKREN